ncbi:MAG: peroxidase-related enzyme [Pseudomonadales bacterium]|jgi:4-carboxymuconolactone decarboxylase|nr:peroxidase-related enzyme [Pseudomonadales bacterium]MDP6470495.1 peroxidase-related enzyme [Pseudomonadales bacterium]MDP6827797.1 peroxidase-related enzyme [Pseudomonadales bacterium]MDP6972969.1 peroxidase-related enzyme [Pseudomonadales bacterium]
MSDISRYPVPSLASLPADIRERIEAVAEKSGFIPNVFVVLAHRPDEFRAFFDYHDAVMSREGGLTKAEKEMIVVATSAANDCTYCVVAHGAILRIFARDAYIADQIAVSHRSAPLSTRQHAMLDVAVKFARVPQSVDDADYALLYEQGFDDEDIWDIAAISGLFALSNRMAHLTAMQPNPEFYIMGR